MAAGVGKAAWDVQAKVGKHDDRKRPIPFAGHGNNNNNNRCTIDKRGLRRPLSRRARLSLLRGGRGVSFYLYDNGCEFSAACAAACERAGLARVSEPHLARFAIAPLLRRTLER